MSFEMTATLTPTALIVVSPLLANDPTLLVALSPKPTFSGLQIFFEASDDNGLNYFSLAACRNDTFAFESTAYPLVIADNTGRQWRVDIRGQKRFRVRATALAAGSVNVRFIGLSSSTDRDPLYDQARLAPEYWAAQRQAGGACYPGIT